MKTQIFKIILILPLLIGNCSMEKIKSIYFSDIKGFYYRDKPISYKIVNNLKFKLYYYVGLEGFFDNNWQLVVDDIDPDAPEKAEIIKTIESGTVKIETHGPLHFFNDTTIGAVPEENKINIKKYRLILNYKSKNNELDSFCYSKEFNVK